MESRVRIPQDELIAFCEKYPIRRLSLFGSVLRDDFGPESDIDVLVEFEPGAHVGWEIVTMQDELSNILNQPVDLNTPASLSRHFRKKVMQDAQVIYERTG
jgi:predicted nucleotidyltransferase